MDYLQQMEVLVSVANEGSFAAAARRLGYSAPTVTRAIASLEQRIGTRFIIRNTRGIRLSDAGRRYLTHARNILVEVSEAEKAALGMHNRPQGSLSITAPVMFGLKHVVPVMNEYLDIYPEVSADIKLNDCVVNLTDAGVDVAVRIGRLPDSSLIASQVGTVRLVLVASPEYLERSGAPEHPNELEKHSLIVTEISVYSNLWQFGGSKGKLSLRVKPAVCANQIAAAIDLAKAGRGIARVLSYQIADEVSAGELVVLLPEYEPEVLPVNILYTEGRDPSAKVRRFVDLSVKRLRQRTAEISKSVGK